MEEYLRRLASLLPGPIRSAANALIDRLIAVWRWSQSLAVRVRGGWQRVRTGARRLRDGIDRLGTEIHTTLWWLSIVKAPSLARWARDRAITWARDRVAELRAAVSAARTFAAAAVGRLRCEALGLLAGLRTWAAGLIGRALSGVDRLLSRVFGTWGTPARLAAWLAGAMWLALWRHAESNIERLAEYAWRRRRRITLTALDEIEAIVRHVL